MYIKPPYLLLLYETEDVGNFKSENHKKKLEIIDG